MALDDGGTGPQHDYHSTGNQTTIVYTVEARVKDGGRPMPYAGTIHDQNWRQVHFPTSEAGGGVKIDVFDKATLAHGLLNYEAAMALAWTFVANGPRFALEVRLVEHSFESTFKIRRTGVEFPQDASLRRHLVKMDETHAHKRPLIISLDTSNDAP